MKKFHVELNDTEVLLNGNPVENPALRVLLGGLAVLMLGLSIIVMGIAAIIVTIDIFALVFLIAILSPLWLPINFVLQRNGRNGFLIHQAGSTTHDFSLDSFRKVSN